MNILLTGKTQVGKSTIIEKFISNFDGTLSGFLTKKLAYNAKEKGIFIFDINDKVRKCDDTNLVGICGKMCIKEKFDLPFETIGVNSLKNKDVDLMIMDEIGMMERDCTEFLMQINSALNSKTPVLGVIKLKDHPLLNKITSRDDVVLLHIDNNNRDEMLKKVIKLLNQ